MNDIVEQARKRAISYRECGPSAEHTAAMLDELAFHVERLSAELAAMQKQRDKTIRLLGVMVEYIGDDMPSGPPVPDHYCDAIHRPDIGVCKFCDGWQDANILLYGDEWGSEYDAEGDSNVLL
jgi:hypothetical protein